MAVHEIEVFLDEIKDISHYQADLKTKRAVERNLEIIGEAANRMSRLQADLPITHLHNIIGTRNKIIHGYDQVSDELIWSIVKHSLPVLKDEVKGIIGEK